MSVQEKKPGYIITLFRNRCPRCREGELFVHPNPYRLRTCVRMHEKCPVCGQPTEIEVGFYYGTSYISYGLAVLSSALSCILWKLTIGFSLQDNRFFWWLGFNAILLVALQPPLMRFSRTLWLSFFVSFDPYWKEREIDKESLERIVPEQMKNW